jgi:hypothetical protein
LSALTLELSLPPQKNNFVNFVLTIFRFNFDKKIHAQVTFSTTQLNNNKITLLSKIVTNKISSVYNFEKLFFAIFLSPGPSVAGIEPLTPGVNFTNIL